MAIRIFFTQWTEQASGGLVYIKEPITEALGNLSLSAPVEITNYIARRAANYRPDKGHFIVVVRGNLTTAEWDMLAGLAGVRMLPAARFDMQLSSVPVKIRNQIYAALDALGISRTTYDSSTTVGGFLRNVQQDLNNTYSGYGEAETLPAEWA